MRDDKKCQQLRWSYFTAKAKGCLKYKRNRQTNKVRKNEKLCA
jgi:hypothetical protein